MHSTNIQLPLLLALLATSLSHDKAKLFFILFTCCTLRLHVCPSSIPRRRRRDQGSCIERKWTADEMTICRCIFTGCKKASTYYLGSFYFWKLVKVMRWPCKLDLGYEEDAYLMFWTSCYELRMQMQLGMQCDLMLAYQYLMRRK